MRFVVSEPSGKKKSYDTDNFHKEVVSIGRQPDNDIVLNYDFISRVHGAIYQEGNHFYIEDLDSTNGIYVNGMKIKRVGLKPGDCVVLARSLQDTNQIKFSIEGESVPEQPTYVQSFGDNAGGIPGNYMQQANNVMYPQQPMAWFKFLIYFQLFASAFICLLLAIASFGGYMDLENASDSMQYLYWADSLLETDYASSIESIKIQYIIVGILAVSVAIACIFVRNQLAEFKMNAPKNYYILCFAVAIVISFFFAIGVQEVIIYNNRMDWVLQGGKVNEDVIGAIAMETGVILFIAAGNVILNKLYFEKRKQLFIR